MFTMTCEKCGSQHELDEGRVPPSGMVMKCRKCAANMTVTAPIMEELNLEFSNAGPMPGPPGAIRPPAPTVMGLGGGGRMPAMPPMPGGGASKAQPLGGPALAAFDAGAFDEEPDLLAPRGTYGAAPANMRDAEFDLDDLPAPKGAGPADIVDLPAPKGATPSRQPSLADVPDLLAPVGPSATRGGPNMDAADLLAPVGPVGTRGGAPDLLAPVGPVGTRGGAPDLLAPVGPVPTRNMPDLLTPVGPTSSRNAPDLLTPVGPGPSGNLLAPKGFFDDAPPPAQPNMTIQGHATGMAPARSPAPPPPLDLDDLDLIPAGQAGMGAPQDDQPPPALDFDQQQPHTNSGPAASALDNLDLLPPEPAKAPGAPDPAGMNFGEVDLPQTGEQAGTGGQAGVISFGKPGSARTARNAADDALDLSTEAAARPRNATLAMDIVSPVADAKDLGRATPAVGDQDKAAPQKKVLTPAEIRQRKLIAASAGVFLVLAGVGYYVYSRIQAEKDRKHQIANGLIETHKNMASDESGHWDRAIVSAQKVLRLDAKNADALGIEAQASYAAAIDEGINAKSRIDTAEGIMSQIAKAAAQGPEVEKAEALRAIVDEKPEEAKRLLGTLAKKQKLDADLPLFLGWTELGAHNPPAAKTAFESALARTPDRLPALFGLGRAQLLMGDSKAAKITFENVLKKRSTHIGARVGLAELVPHDREGTREKRLLEIVNDKDTASAHPHDLSRAWSLAGDEAIVAGHVQEAELRYTKATDLDSHNLDAVVGLGVTAMEQHKYPEAHARLEQVMSQDPFRNENGVKTGNMRALIALTRLDLREDKVGEAHSAIDKAAILAPDDAEVQIWMGHVQELDPMGGGPAGAEQSYRKAIEIDHERYDAYVSLSNLLLTEGKTDPAKKEEALKVLEPVQQAAQNDPNLSNTLGMAYLTGGQSDKAEQWFRNALKLDDTNVEARANLGSALEAQGKTKEAIAEYEAAHKGDPSREDVALRLAAGYERAKRYADAEEQFKALLKPPKGAPSVAARSAAGRFYARRGQPDEAGKLGDSIFAEDQHNPAALFLKGFALLYQGKAPDGQKMMYDAVALEPQAQYYDGLGRAYEAQKNFDEAIAVYDKAIRLDATYPAPRMGRSRIFVAKHDWNAALPELATVEKIEPENAQAYFLSGQCLTGLAQKDKAIAAYGEAVKRDPKLAEAYFDMGEIYYDKENSAAAATNYRLAIQHGEKDDEWLPQAHLHLAYAVRSSNKAEMCRELTDFLNTAPESDGERGGADRLRMSCPDWHQ